MLSGEEAARRVQELDVQYQRIGELERRYQRLDAEYLIALGREDYS